MWINYVPTVEKKNYKVDKNTDMNKGRSNWTLQ